MAEDVKSGFGFYNLQRIVNQCVTFYRGGEPNPLPPAGHNCSTLVAIPSRIRSRIAFVSGPYRASTRSSTIAFAPIWVTPPLAWSYVDLDELTSKPMTSAV